MNFREKSWIAPRGRGFGFMLMLLVGVVSVFLIGIFLPGTTLFSNDGPLARLVMECHRLPQRFTGCWDDLYAIGFSEGAATPTISCGLLWLLGPLWFSKCYAIVALVILGIGAWTFFRQAGLAPAACVLGSLAASLNSDMFTTACWGVAAHPIVVGMAFFAMAALFDTGSGRRWLWVALAGLAVGMGVAEGADIGALFSLVVAGFLGYQALTAHGPAFKNISMGFVRMAVVVAFALFMAAEGVYQLVAIDVKGVVTGSPEQQTAQGRWDWTTEWSLPKIESLSLFVPGLFGYRMDSPYGGTYWGAIGRNAEWDRYFQNDQKGPPPGSLIRYTGGSFYAGVPVVLIALWALTQSLRRKASLFDLPRRKWIWFWAGVALISLLFAFGRFAPFYGLIYHLPFFSTMRNPTKFLHVVSMAVVVLFAYGADGLWRGYMANRPANAVAPGGRGRVSGVGLLAFDRYWIYGCGAAMVVILLAWLGYSNKHPSLEGYLQTVGFRDFQAAEVAAFSVRQAGWFVLLFAISAGLLAMILKRFFAGSGGRWGGLCLGVLLVADLWHADTPWIIYWNYVSKYASNPVIDLLRQQPYEHRVTMLPATPPPKLQGLERLYKIEWLQQTMPYYNIQSIDIVQLARRPQDLAAYDEAFEIADEIEGARRFGRRMQLTNTRYAFGLASYLDALNAQLDPDQHRVRIAARFDVIAKPGIERASRAADMTAALNANGPYALFEHTGVLPRAGLFQRWEVHTNDHEVLDLLISRSFDPAQKVLVSSAIPAGAPVGGPSPDSGRAEITRYTSRRVDIKTEAGSPAVLLLNDRFAPGWKVWVDGHPETLLRCNYIMRGVFLGSGPHEVTFRFQPEVQFLYVSAVAVGLAVVLLAFLGAVSLRQPVLASNPASRARPAPPRPGPEPQLKPAAGNGRSRNRK